MTRRTRSRLSLATLSLFTASLATPLLADPADRYWVGTGDGLWSDPNNWSLSPASPGGAGAPTNMDRVHVNVTNPTTLTIDVPVYPMYANLSGTADAPLTVNQATDSFGPATFGVGPYATFNQTTGTDHASGSVTIDGAYYLSGDAQLINSSNIWINGTAHQSGGFLGGEGVNTISGHYDLSAGNMGSDVIFLLGTFTQSGGTVGGDGTSTAELPSDVTLGAVPNSIGTYTLSAGSLATANLTIGSGGTGSFVQTGGTLFLRSLSSSVPTLTLASSPGSSGTYALSGTGSIADPTDSASLKVGDAGSGTLTLSDSAYAIVHSITLGNSPTGTGTLLQSGGHLYVSGLTVGNAGAGTLVQSAGGLTAYDSFIVGSADGSHGTISLSGTASLDGYMGESVANGEFVQTGGHNYSAGSLHVDAWPDSHASYTLAAGTLYVDYLFVGNGSFLQTGGSLSTYGIHLGDRPNSSASYTLTGGTLSTVGDQTYIGDAALATFTQTGGTFSSYSSVGVNPGSVYSLSGTGVLEISGGFPLAIGGTFVQSGGTILGRSIIRPTGHYIFSGGTFPAGPCDVSGTLTQTGGAALLNDASIQPSAIYDLLAGSLSTHAISNAGTFYMSPTASLTFTGPTFTNTGSATLDGLQSWPDNATFSNTLVAFFHSDPGSPTRAPLSVTSDSPDWAPLVFDAPATHLASLTLLGHSHASLPPSSPAAAPRLLSTHSLTIADSAQLDLADNTLLLTNPPGPSPLDLIRQYLLTHQLFSSTTDPTHRLAYLSSGDPSAPTSLTVTLALTGDANLDGKVDADDYALLDRSYASSLPDPHWQDGDFNYDGIVDASDYLIIDTTLGQAQGFSPAFLSQRQSQFGPAYVSTLLASVPEPTSLSLLLLLPTLLLPRRRAAP